MKIPEWDLLLDDDWRNPKLLFKHDYYVDDGIIFTTPKAIFEFFKSQLYLHKLAEERVYIVGRRSNKIIGLSEVSHGDAQCSLCGIREIFIRLFLMGANDFVVVHNHPSGNCTPSKNDVYCLQKLLIAGNIMGIPIIDDLIITTSRYYSAKDTGEIDEFNEKAKTIAEEYISKMRRTE